MTGDGDGGPSAGGAAGRRRDLLERVGAELRALRTDLTETGGLVREHVTLLSEALPRLDALEHDAARVRGTLDALTDATSEREVDTAEQAARAAVGMANKPTGPWEWPVLDAEQATDAWEALARWVGEVLCAWYTPTRGELPDCWALHRGAVVELTWLRQTYVEAHAAGAPAHLAADWHVRWRPAALANVRAAVDPDQCLPGMHRADLQDRTQRPDLRAQERTRAEPATPAHWHPHLRAAADADVAGRRPPPQNGGSSS